MEGIAEPGKERTALAAKKKVEMDGGFTLHNSERQGGGDLRRKTVPATASITDRQKMREPQAENRSDDWVGLQAL